MRKCPPCSSYEALGDELRQAQYLILEEVEVVKPLTVERDRAPDRWQDALLALGLRASLYQRREDIPSSTGNRRTILALSDQALVDQQGKLVLTPHNRTAVGRRFLVNVTPTITAKEIADLKRQGVQELPSADSTKPFHALEAQSEGIPRLGVLRMDVDDLGKLFAEGLGQQATLSRVAALSSAVSLFFEGWVEQLAAEQNRQDKQAGTGERLYSIYSGGDDLFFVGSWDAVVELWWESQDAMESAWRTPAGQAATDDLAEFADVQRTSWSIVDEQIRR